MLSVKRLIQLFCIILLFCVLFLYLNISNQGLPDAGRVNQAPAEAQRQSSQQPQGLLSQDRYYVVFNHGTEEEGMAAEQAALFLDAMKLPYEKKTYLVRDDLGEGTVPIFCNATISQAVDLELFADYIRQGGKAVFASGVPEGYVDTYLNPMLGVVEKGLLRECGELTVKEDFLPCPSMEISYPGYQASRVLKLEKEAEVYVEGAEGLPVIYSHEYGKGRVLVFNGNLMQSRYTGGLFAASLGALRGELLYPVVGTATVFLDNFPTFFSGIDILSTELYGRSNESLERDVIWPKLLEYSSRYEAKYTINLLDGEYEEGVVNPRLLSYLSKEVLRRGGEVMMSRDLSGAGAAGTWETEDVYSVFKEKYPAYQIRAVGALGGTLGETLEGAAGRDELARLQSLYDGAKVVRGSYDGEEEYELVTVLADADGYIGFPVMSSGFDQSQSAYQYFTGLGLYGMVSHSLPMDRLLVGGGEENLWEHVSGDLEGLLDAYLGGAPWLLPATITEAASAAEAYLGLSVSFTAGDGRLVAQCRDLAPGQKFYLRSDHPVSAAEGAAVRQLSDSWYLLEAENADFSAILGE